MCDFLKTTTIKFSSKAGLFVNSSYYKHIITNALREKKSENGLDI